MKRFRFPLDALIKVRQAKVDEARLKLAETERSRLREEELIMEISRKIEEAAEQSERSGAIDAVSLAAEQEYVGHLRAERERALSRLERWIALVEKDRKRLLEARRDLEALERLREKRYLEFVREVLREETKEIDEAASVRHARKEAA